jgi:hypothetical protein
LDGRQKVFAGLHEDGAAASRGPGGNVSGAIANHEAGV